MLSPTLARLGAWCGVAAGLTLGLPAAVEAVTGETPATGLVLALSPALAIPLLVVLHLRQAAVTGRSGAIAVTVNLVGLGLFGGAGFALNIVLVHLDEAAVRDLVRGPVLLAFLGSAVVFAAGTVLFGVATVRAGVLPRVPAIAYTVALPVLALAAPLPDNLATSALHVVSGAALVWLAASAVGGPLAQERQHGGDAAVHRPVGQP